MEKRLRETIREGNRRRMERSRNFSSNKSSRCVTAFSRRRVVRVYTRVRAFLFSEGRAIFKRRPREAVRGSETKQKKIKIKGVRKKREKRKAEGGVARERARARLSESQECENVLQFRNQACLLVCAKARYRKPLTSGLRTAPASPQKRIAVPSGNTH